MTASDDQPLFTISNHHDVSCGQPPMVNGDTSNSYHGYFENLYGEQFVFVYNYDTNQGVLWCGDSGWERPYPVKDGRVRDLILSSEEQMWLQVCWHTAHREN